MASAPVLRHAIPAVEPLWQAVGICERIVSALLLCAASPALLASAVALRWVSGRSPLIAHRRVGWRGETLWMLKLRTMWNSPNRDGGTRWIEYIDDDAGPAEKHAQDPRIGNRFARFCRRHSIDEVPQLWHVIRGEMSLVGPRPVTATELQMYYGEDAEEVLRVKPGIAGLWQTSGRNRLTYDERRALDLRFVRERSPRMYMKILLRTAPEVLTGTNSW